jgi:hypothetical protein
LEGVRDEKMLEKLTTHDIQYVSALFSLADKCARAACGTPQRFRQARRRATPTLGPRLRALVARTRRRTLATTSR